MRVMSVLMLALASSTASAELPRQCYTGYAYHADSDRLAYTARYLPVGSADASERWRVVYRGPDGGVIARKRMDFGHHRFVPEFTLNIQASGDMAGVRRGSDGDWRMVERKGSNGERVIEPFELRADMAGDTGIYPFMRAHFRQLMDSDGLTFPLVLAPRQRVVDMHLGRIDDTVVAGERAVRFRASVDMLFAGWFADELTFTYDPETRRLLRYRGLSNMQDEDGEPYPVRVRYRPSDPPEGASNCPA